ncbi:hypothetical protein HOG17_05390 [Candidatus Peregrinibacteria bacterium]|nr:hypothetical protein [Candidatus Peregrinibacteria bacterium]MBT4148163.1 hypothetical protein [Candidatus Peregrinibacteria bacterium]MBT4366650.1 hypothetical protein [Candidatus Peregrinibacteria bacterium]MBT4455637.1 hypothetical protein [Candidatus Peregrinibacteria bacterium]
MPDFDSIKVAAAKLETTKSDFQIDDVKELHYTLIEGRKAALKDIKDDVKKAYPGNEDKQKEEMKVVNITLKRLERGYKQKSKKDVGNFGKLADQYIKDLEHITGVDLKYKTVEKMNPEDFWKDTTGWYEEGLAEVEKEDEDGVKITKLESTFEEEVIEDLISKGNWISEIHEHKNEKGKIADAEKFQKFLETNQKELRQLVLRPLGSGKYLIDFSNISKEFEKATKESALKSDFIAKNIGLADLFSQRTEALTIWGKNGIQTGILDEEHERKNGLKGGYLTPEGSYLTLWHGSVVSLESADSIDDEVAGGLFAGEDPESEERTEEDLEKSKHITIVSRKPDGSDTTEIRVKYTPEVDLAVPKEPTKPTPTTPEYEAALKEYEAAKKEYEATLEEHTASLIERRKKLEGTTDDPTGEFKYKTTITTIDPAISATEPIKKEIEAKFTATKYSPKKFTSLDQDFDYQGTGTYENLFISIPMNNQESYVLVAMIQKGKGPKTMKIFESKDLSKFKERLNDEIDAIDKGWMSKPDLSSTKPKKTGYEEDRNPWGQMEAIEFDKTCSKETIDRYLRLTTTTTLAKVDRIFVQSDNYKHALELADLTKKDAPVTFLDTQITDEGIDALLLNEDTTTKLKFKSNQKLTKQGLFKLREKVPNITEITLDHVKLTERGALAEIAKFPNLTRLEINRSVIVASDLEAVGSSTSLTQLELIDLPTVSDLDIRLMLEDAETKNTKLSQLTTLRITGSRITDESIQYIKNLDKLTTLDLSGNKGLTYKGMQGLIPVDFYSELGANYVDQTDQNLTLTDLNLSNTEINNAALPYLRYFGKLNNINLENTKIDAKGLDTLFKVINPETLMSLNLKNTNLTEKEFVDFSNKLITLIEDFKMLNQYIEPKFENIIDPNGKKYTYIELFDYVNRYKSPKEITAEEEAKKAEKFETLETTKLAALNTLFSGINRKYSVEWKKGYPIRNSKKYIANIKGSGGYRIRGYLDEEKFDIATPPPGNQKVNLNSIKEDSFEKKVIEYFRLIEEKIDKEGEYKKRIKDETFRFRSYGNLTVMPIKNGITKDKIDRTFKAELRYGDKEKIADISGNLGNKEIKMTITEAKGKTKEIDIDYIERFVAQKEKEEAAKAEEEAAKAKEEAQKAKERTRLTKELNKKTNKSLKKFNKSLYLDTKTSGIDVDSSTFKGNIYMKGNSEIIGKITQKIDMSNIPYKEEGNPKIFCNRKKISGTTLDEKIKNLVIEKANTKIGKTEDKIKKHIQKKKDELKSYFEGLNLTVSVDIENMRIVLSKTKNPYIKFDIIYSASAPATPTSSSFSEKEKIGTIDAWLLKDPDITTLNNDEDTTDLIDLLKR